MLILVLYIIIEVKKYLLCLRNDLVKLDKDNS